MDDVANEVLRLLIGLEIPVMMSTQKDRCFLGSGGVHADLPC